MVIIEFLHAVRDSEDEPSRAEALAHLCVDGQATEIDGDGSVVDFEQKVLSPRTGELISFKDAGEDWARGLVATYTTPYLWAHIVRDTDPVDDIEVPSVHIELPEGALHAV